MHASPVDSQVEAVDQLGKSSRGVSGNFQQKRYPVNPIQYLGERGISSVFRYIQTHPDMDHMDGIEPFFDAFSPINFWDTDNEEEKDFELGGPTVSLIGCSTRSFAMRSHPLPPDVFTLEPGSRGEFYNLPNEGDGIHILAPTDSLVADANRTGDYNDASYVILYRSSEHQIVFAGDSA